MPFKSNGSLNGGGDVTPTTVTALNNRAEIDTKRQGRFAIGARVKSFAPDDNRVKLKAEDLDTGEVSIFFLLKALSHIVLCAMTQIFVCIFYVLQVQVPVQCTVSGQKFGIRLFHDVASKKFKKLRLFQYLNSFSRVIYSK